VVTIRCTVRGCGKPLVPCERSLACANGHAFDRARTGYVNVLQPQDRRSRHPGDSAEAAAARRRLVRAGFEEPITSALLDLVAADGGPALDVGCGEGSFAARLVRERGLETVGLDISAAAVDLAARAFPDVDWIVANADRALPFDDGAFAVVASITSRRNGPELGRVLARGGRLVVAVPAAEDLAELRDAVYGSRTSFAGGARVAEELAVWFALERATTVSATATLDGAAIADLLATTYRGARRSERTRVDALETLDVTFARDVLVFANRR
jgi:23S rRNA (guanine745-N1)-methyltransferase